MKELFFSFGALGESISKQYEEQGFKLINADKWDKALECIIYLHIHNLLTDSRYDECLNKLIKETKKDIFSKQSEDIVEK